MRDITQWVFEQLEWIGAHVQGIVTEKHYRKPRFWVMVVCIISMLLLLSHCSSFQKKHKKNNSLPVVVAAAKTSDVPVYLSELGSVSPTDSVTVRTQISGQLIRVLYKEGQLVKVNDLLVEIDPRPYEAQLTQYEGQLARDRALLANARLDLQRYQTLWRKDSVAKQTLDTQASLVKQDEGVVKLDEGLLQATQVNLTYTKITSPINGRIGLRLVDPGNYVTPSDTTGIAVINTLNPIDVVFSIPEDNVPEVMTQMNASQPLPVDAYDRSQTTLLDKGQLLTIDNQIDLTTGTVKLKAQFENKSNLLFPNQFVNVKLLLKTLHNATIIPTAAIQHGAQNDFVYVVDENDKVAAKSVTAGVTIDENTVVTGIDVGQSVVVEGADKLTEGETVKIAKNEPKKKSVKE